MHPRLAAVAEHGMRRAAANVAHRVAIGRIYHDLLSPLVPEWLPADVALVRFPLVVEDAADLTRLLRGRGLDLGPRWFEAPVHPSGAMSSYRPGSAPAAERLAARVVTLPTHPRVSEDEARSIAAAVAAVTNLR
jgi:dTDP-4-amino-4,6-dideoxygalactose transaminase